MNKENVFKPRARLILQLGNELIKNESIALVELIKNSYDAGASVVRVTMEKLEDKKHGSITIFDDGRGMDKDVITNVWLQPGSDYKKLLLENNTQIFSGFYRRPLGEKGIGRFSVHKLGKKIELITRMSDKDEVVVNIDWSDFEKVTFMDDVEIDVVERKPELFTGDRTGTCIKIHDLREGQWTEAAIKDAYHSAVAICSPFQTNDAFRVDFDVPDNKGILEKIPTIDDIRESSLYRFRCEITGDEVTSFSYSFCPYASMELLKGKARTLTYGVAGKDDNIDGFEKIKNMVGKQVRNPATNKKESPPIDLAADGLRVGKVVFEGFIFDRARKILKYADIESSVLVDYLNRNGGVRVYRDGIRVYDYGEPENDWLGLERSRIYDPGVKLNRTLMLAAVHLDRESSTDLIEKTNREGFVDNNASRRLKDAILYLTKIVETYRNEDKDLVRNCYGLSEKAEPVLESISDLREFVQSGITDDNVRDKCVDYLDKIEREYKEINEVLLTSAEAGLNMSVAIHEIEKIAAELKKVAQAEKSATRVLKLIERLDEMIEMYATLIRKSRKKTEDVKHLVKDALFHVQYRLKAHDIELVRDFIDFKGHTEIQCSSRLVIGAILNLVDNSIYWLERKRIKNRKILIRLEKKDDKFIDLLVADNGDGFALPPEQMIKPFVGLKSGGMGLGLHIASEILAAQGGRVEFPAFRGLGLPHEFQRGAIVVLSFKIHKKDE